MVLASYWGHGQCSFNARGRAYIWRRWKDIVWRRSFNFVLYCRHMDWCKEPKMFSFVETESNIADPARSRYVYLGCAKITFFSNYTHYYLINFWGWLKYATHQIWLNSNLVAKRRYWSRQFWIWNWSIYFRKYHNLCSTAWICAKFGMHHFFRQLNNFIGCPVKFER